MSFQALDVIRDPRSVFQRSDEVGAGGHEQVVYCRDQRSGLKAIIAIHSTSRGPALGGTRFLAYPSETHALVDVLRLSQGMTFKAAAAGIPHGGGKGVIIGDPATHKTRDLLVAYGEFVNRLGGHYVTAADVGTTSGDLDVIGQATSHVVGRSRATGSSGDSGFSTAYGVLAAMRAAAAAVWKDGGLQGRTVGVEGLGKVGSPLVKLLVQEGARVLVCDPDEAAVRQVVETNRGVAVLSRVIDAEVDVYAPCALGATLTAASVKSVRARAICGAANNQLAEATVDEQLTDRGILWVPDYVASAGGLIQVGSELRNLVESEVESAIKGIGATVGEIIERSRSEGVPMGAAAMRLVESRLRAEAEDRDGC